MNKRYNKIVAAVGPQLAPEFAGANAGAHADAIDRLPTAQRNALHQILANSLRYVWIMYVCFAAAGLVTGFFITKQTLNRNHEETKTGLAAEEENRRRVLEERQAAAKGRDVELGDRAVAETGRNSSA